MGTEGEGSGDKRGADESGPISPQHLGGERDDETSAGEGETLLSDEDLEEAEPAREAPTGKFGGEFGGKAGENTGETGRISRPPPVPAQARRSSIPAPPPPASRIPPPAVAQSGTWRVPSNPPPLPARSGTTQVSAPPPPPSRAQLGDHPGGELGLLRAQLEEARSYIARLRLQARRREDRLVELERLCARDRGAELAEARERIASLESELRHVRATARAAGDDLKQIPGVGPGFERALRELGITEFAQIARWTASDVEEVAASIRTRPGRILRDGWVEHARRLARELSPSSAVGGNSAPEANAERASEEQAPEPSQPQQLEPTPGTSGNA